MKLIFTSIFLFWCVLFIASVAHGQQAILDKTTFGKSQNDDRDIANSLKAGPQKYGKGEKKAQVGAAELKSKSIKDATFGGSLLNEGIDAAAPKLDPSKEHAAPSEETPSSTKAAATEQTSSASQQPAPVEQSSGATSEPRVPESGFSFSNLSQTATLADQLYQSEVAARTASTSKSAGNSSANGDTQKKDQGGEKPFNATEKPSDH